jgi:hypothetical protein
MKESEIMRNSIKSAVPLVAVALAGCLQVCEAQAASQRTFASAEDASHALFMAVEDEDTTALTQLLGSNNELASSSDPTQDKLEREQFERKYREMHRLARERDGEVVLYVGAENWPFPIPIVSRGGVWRYDADTGAKEVLYRRVGENEVTAIETCHALIATLQEPQEHSDASNSAASLLRAARAGNKPVPFRGYSFRLLSKPGDSTFGIVAYPTAYGSSGVVTFMVNDAGVVYQKDLGANTGRVATKMAAYQADATWVPAEPGLDAP